MQLTAFLSNAGVALLCGLLIGLERQWSQHPAGLRTNALISMGAALFASLSTLIEHESSPTRVAGQIVTGVGFLAGGVILRDGLTIKGLTTAATIWCTAAVGTLSGCGFLLFAFVSTLIVLFLNIVMLPLSQWIDKQSKKRGTREHRYQLLVTCTEESSALARMMIIQYFQSQQLLTLQSITQKDATKNGQVQILGVFVADDKCDHALENMMAMLHVEKGVSEVRWERLHNEPSA